MGASFRAVGNFSKVHGQRSILMCIPHQSNFSGLASRARGEVAFDIALFALAAAGPHRYRGCIAHQFRRSDQEIG